ncbi:MAG: efflux RND transporter periplasmic adaptor subunit [Gemmatimonadaceae bacterium]|nr:efflux RND transporter periplasmic adaptor subunit [Gemmatimonadaceae bacterium]
MPYRGLLVPLVAAALGCSGQSEGAPVPQAMSASTPADTALLSAESVKIAGFTTSLVTRSAWRDAWSVPARLTLDAANTEPIGSVVEGRVMKAYVMPGDRVRKNQVLLAIHSHEMMNARAAIARARAEMTRAESNARVAQSAGERAERLYTLKALGLAELERARGARTDAEAIRDGAAAEVARAAGMLDHLVGSGPMPPDYDEHWVLVRAPLDGLVISREVQPGQVVTVGAPLVTVSRPTALTLVMQLQDAAVAAATLGAPVEFSVGAHPERVFRARVARVFPSVDTLTRTVEVHAAVSDNSGLLRPEMFANAQLLGAAGRAVATVPAGAVQAFEGDTVVIAAEQRGEGLRLEAVPVRIGRRTRDRAEVVAGLDSGATVIVGGASVAKAEILKRRGR